LSVGQPFGKLINTSVLVVTKKPNKQTCKQREAIVKHAGIAPRARIGFIIPSSNRMAEPNFQRYSPSGVVPHFMRLRMSGKHRKSFDDLIAGLEEAASILGDAKCDVTVLQCTGTSMSGGFGGETAMVKAIERATGRPGLTTANCLMMALERIRARRLVFISENDAAGYEEKKRFLQSAGMEIVGGRGAALVSDESCTTPPAFWADIAHEERSDRADAYFISCANIQAIDVIESLEAYLGKPVLTSNQVALWAAIRTVGITDTLEGLGHLGECQLVAREAA
jgi:maleate isomerase